VCQKMKLYDALKLSDGTEDSKPGKIAC